jgi:putative metallohydrolase (TIGR04338 family)
MPKVKDQAGRLYAAEEMSGIKYGDSMTLKECQKFVDKVLSRKYIIEKYGIQAQRPILVLDGRGRRKACATFQHGRRVIKLPRWARGKYVILHEVAHHLTDLNGHRAEFASCLLDLVRHFMGKDSADALQGAFHLRGVKVLGKTGTTKARCPQSRKSWVEQKKESEKIRKELGGVHIYSDLDKLIGRSA